MMCITAMYSNIFSRAAQLYREKIANQATAAQKIYGTKVLYAMCKIISVVLLFGNLYIKGYLNYLPVCLFTTLY